MGVETGLSLCPVNSLLCIRFCVHLLGCVPDIAGPWLVARAVFASCLCLPFACCLCDLFRSLKK